MKKKKLSVQVEQDLLVDLTLHNLPGSLVTEFIEKIARPYYRGNVNGALQDLLLMTLAEQDFVHSHIVYVRDFKSD
jgi:hypothetical protein